MGRYAGPNAEVIEAWDTVLFDKYERFRHIVTNGYSIHGDIAMDRLALRPGARVVDLGCSYGDTTRALAQRVGATGEVVGVDASPRFIAKAADQAKAAKVENVRCGVRDIQTDDLGGPYDVAFSLYGVMFLVSPVQGFRNVHRSLAPGGRLCVVVWRKREDNPWLNIAERIVRELIPEDAHANSDAVTCGPGPFSMISADMVGDQLVKAGFERITFERSDQQVMFGRDAEEAVAFAMALGPAGEIVRLAGDEGVRKKADVEAALAKAFEEMRGADGAVRGGSSTWIITASPRRDTSR